MHKNIPSHPKFYLLKDYFDRSLEKFKDDIAFVDLKSNIKITFNDFGNACIYSAFSLGKKVGNNTQCVILCENCTAYMIAYFSIILSNNVAVLVACDLDEDTLAQQIDYADCRTIFISDQYLNKLDTIKTKCPKLENVILIGENTDAFETLDDLIQDGRNHKEEAINTYNSLKTTPQQNCQILYTSGTVGYNKAVMLNNENVCCSVYSALQYFGRYKDTISILPFYHAYENSCHALPAFFCGCTNHINDSFTHLFKNMKTVPAQMSVVVPMVLETMSSKILSEVKRQHADKRLAKAIKLSNALRKVGIDLREKLFNQILINISDTLRIFVVGGAAISEETYDFLSNIGFTIITGYGETECAPLIACNTPEKHDKKTVGHIIEDMKVKIVNVDENGNGEILVKGKGVMSGYYKDDEANKNVFNEQGWLYTGDLGHFDNKGRLCICGRLKNLIILSNGKNIYPEEMESLISKKYSYIKEIIVSTDRKQTGIFADIYVDDEYSKEKTDEELYKLIKSDIDIFNQKMPKYKYIKDIRISRQPFKKNINKKIIRSYH